MTELRLICRGKKARQNLLGALSAVTLFAVGAYSVKTLVGDWRKSRLQMVTIGLGAAALGFVRAIVSITR